MAADLSTDAGAQAAADLALRIGSHAADAISFVAELGEELPFISPVLKTLTAIREKVETVNSNREGLTALEVRCSYITACVAVKCRQNSRSEMDVAPLTDCVKAIGEFVERCGRRGRVSRVLKASSDKDEIAGLNARVDRLTGDLGLAGVAVLEGKADDMKAMLREVLNHLTKMPIRLANAPKGAPTRRSWHVERRHVTDAVLKSLSVSKGPRLVGLVGDSGSGKTTAASEIVRSIEVREVFSDGIVWLTVNAGAKERLAALMMQLARMVYEDVGGSVGVPPEASEDGAAYVKKCMERGHGGEGLRCLVVADNVWELEVVSKLLKTGMWVLLSTRYGNLVSVVGGEAVGVTKLSEVDAESLLRRTADLPPEVRLPDGAVDLIELCGRVAMDLAFVGRWSTVRGREDRTAWSDAASKVRAAMGAVVGDSEGDRRRRAILQAGFEYLAVGSDDERVPRLYLSLAVMPDGRAFTLKEASVLLYDRQPSPDDEASVRGVVDILERWTIIRSTEEGTYRMHDAHSKFARENLMDRGDVRRPALKRWVKHISSLDTLRSIDRYTLKGLWHAVEQVGGDGWDKTHPYEVALAEMDESDPVLRESIEAVGWFQEVQGDWEGASTTFRRLLEVEKRELGPAHPFVLNSYQSLADWADRLKNAEEAAEWRAKEREELPLALAKAKQRHGRTKPEEVDDANGLVSLASTVLRLTPDDRDEAEHLLRCSLGTQEAELGRDSIEVADTLSRLSKCVRSAGRLEAAEELLGRSLAIREAKLGSDDMRVVSTLHQLGIWVREAGRLEEAETLLRRCLAIQEGKLGLVGVGAAYTLHELGVCVRQAGRSEEAEELLRRCLVNKEAKLGREDVQVAYTLYQLGVWLVDAGHLEEAEHLLRRCLSVEEATLGPEDVRVAHTLNRMGRCVREAGRLEEAEELLRRCLAIEEIKLGRQDVQVAYTLHELGVCIQEAGRLMEAKPLLTRCLAIKEATLGPGDEQVGATLCQLARCVQEAGHLQEAEGLFRRCLAIEEANLGPQHIQVAHALCWLGACVREAGRLEEAEELLRRCLSIVEAQTVPIDLILARTLYQLSVCVRDTPRPREAKEMLRRVLVIVEVNLSQQDAHMGSTLNYPPRKRLRQRVWLEKSMECLKECLAIDEANMGCSRTRTDKLLQQLGVFLVEAVKLI